MSVGQSDICEDSLGRKVDEKLHKNVFSFLLKVFKNSYNSIYFWLPKPKKYTYTGFALKVTYVFVLQSIGNDFVLVVFYTVTITLYLYPIQKKKNIWKISVKLSLLSSKLSDKTFLLDSCLFIFFSFQKILLPHGAVYSCGM